MLGLEGLEHHQKALDLSKASVSSSDSDVSFTSRKVNTKEDDS